MPRLSPATRSRLTLARNISCWLENDPGILAVIATGSVAKNRCSQNSDLDVTVITGDRGIRRTVTSEVREGVTIDIEWLTKTRAKSIMKGGRRDLKGLREASRLGLGVFLLDREGLESGFRELALTLLPDRALIEERMAVLAGALRQLCSGRPGPKGSRWEMCRAFLDNMAFVLLMLHPVRYHKPKWVMADLNDAGYHQVNSLLRRAYRIGTDSLNSSRRSIELSRRFIEEMGRFLKMPSIEDMVKRGFTRKFAAWSYICRTWEDAASLFQDGAFVEANFTAKFAVRMTFPLYFEKFGRNEDSTNPLGILQKIGEDRLSKAYQQLFPVPANRPEPPQRMLIKCRILARACWNLKQRAFGEVN